MLKRIAAMIVWIVFGTAVVTLGSVARADDDSLVPSVQVHGWH
jgi:hypothetical protein